MEKKRRGKYAAELAKIREFKILDTILKKGDVENALLSNTSKDSEPVSDTVIDAMLNSVEKGKVGERDMELIEKLTTKTKPAAPRKAVAPARKKVTHKAGQAPKRAARAVKHSTHSKGKRAKAKRR